MKTDALYLNLFETTPSLALRLAGYDSERGNEYTCTSGELKRSFRVDVVLTPPAESDLPLVLAEVQFQRNTDIYHRIVASCAIACIQQTAEEEREVRMVIFFKNRSVDTGAGRWQSLVNDDELHVVYLDEMSIGARDSTLSVEEQASLLLIRLTVSPEDQGSDEALAQEFGRVVSPLKGQRLYEQFRDFFVNLFVSKYEDLSLTEILAMIDSTEIFDDIGKSLAVRQYAEIQIQQAAEQATLKNAVSFIRAGIPVEQVATILGLSPTAIASALASPE
jgi:predicted transposase YdaD